MAQVQKHLISILMENEAGSLSRVVGLFSQRGYNIDTLNVAATEDPTLSRLTLTTITTEDKIEQITKQLHKLIEVVKVQNLSEVSNGNQIERELMLIKVRATGAHREEVYRIADIFRAQIVDVSANLYTILITGDAGKLDGFIEVIGRDKILEVVRSGVIGIARGERTLSL
ncbi:acetolactate synthase small subunit [Moraxella oblonga]|uniref:acetolactate synthase small subunit n=1 Tax=Moraxella oblonga TaxID=200413 RepID=UPI000830F285|nr:acetolactate synthase small subunit [Moraxella oblonga]